MSDPFGAYESLYRLVEHASANRAQLWKLLLLAMVAVSVAWRVIFAWLHEGISGMEALTLIAALFLAEGAAARWLPDFEGARFLLLLALPLATWIAVQIVVGLSHRESYRADVHAGIKRFRAAIRRDPNNAAAHELLGDSYLKLWQPRRALAEYRASIALDPHSYQTQYKLERAARLSRAR